METAVAHEVLGYYDQNAKAYAERTWSMDMSEERRRFLAALPEGGAILDAGCGSGRDTLAFKNAGYPVAAFDGSAALVAEASQRTGLPVQHLRYDQFEEEARFDGVWACSSLVHLNDDDFRDTLRRFRRAMRPMGTFFLCMKEGKGMRTDAAGRPFNDFTKDRLRTFLRQEGLSLLQIWRTPQRSPEGGWWLNVLCRPVL